MRNEKLLPCPFCGMKGRLHGNDNVGWSVYCFKCTATIVGDTETEVTISWNTRTTIKTEPIKKCNHEYQVKKYITHDIDDPKCEVEYSLFCSLCNKYLGTFSYGAWDYSLGQLSNDHIIEFLKREHRK